MSYDDKCSDMSHSQSVFLLVVRERRGVEVQLLGVVSAVKSVYSEFSRGS